MANEKGKQEDKLPTPTSLPRGNQGLGFLDLTNEAANLTEVFDNTLPPFPYFQTGDMRGMPQSCAQEMPLPAINMMNDVSQYPEVGLDYLYGPVSDISCLEGDVNESGQCHAIQDSVVAVNEVTSATHANDLENTKIEGRVKTTRGDVAKGSEIRRKGRKENSSDIRRPWLIGNQIIHGGSSHLSSHNPTGGEMGINNGAMTCADQSIHPQTLDGSFLNLGVGSNAENRCKSTVRSRDSNLKTNGAVLPQLNTFCGQKADRSSSNPCSKTSGGFSSVQNNEGGFTSLAQNEIGFSRLAQNVDGFSRLAQNVGGVSHQAQNFNEFSNLVQNVGGFSSSTQNGGAFSSQAQTADRFSSPLQNGGAFSSQAQTADRFSSPLQNAGQFAGQSESEGGGISSLLVDKQYYHPFPGNLNLGLRVSRNARFADRNPNAGFQGFPSETLMLHNNNEVGIPDYGQHRATGLTSSPSLVSSTIQSATGQLQNAHMGIIRNFASEHSLVAPFIGVARSVARQDHSAGQPFQAKEVFAAPAAEGGLFSKNIEVQPACNFGQSQATSPIQPSQNICGSADTTGQEISAVIRPGQASSVPLGPSRKRGAAGSYIRKPKKTKPSSHPSTPNVAQTTQPHATLAWTAPLSPPLAQTAHPHPARMIPIFPSLAQTTPTRPPRAQIPFLHPAQTVPFYPPLAQTTHAQPPLGHTAHPFPVQTVPFCPPLDQNTPSRPPLAQTAHPLPALTAPSCPPLAQTTPVCLPLAKTAHPIPGQTTPFCPPLAQTTPARPPLARTARLHQAPPASHSPLVAQTTLARPPLAQTALSWPAPTTPSCPPIPKTTPAPPRLVHTAPRIPRFPRSASPPHIKWQDRTPPPSGMQCPLCKRDLSYTPEGPVYQPLRPPPVAVLPCHHHFHASCLERITSKDQAQNPPCIPCALGDKN